MRTTNRTRPSRRERSRGFSMILTLVFIGFLIPTIGLSIDVGVLYSIRARLSMAVDAGALAGARALARGTTTTAQDTSAKNTAVAYVNANFPSGYFSSYNLTIPTPTIDYTVANQRTVQVTATVTAPLYFLRWVGSNTTDVSAYAQVTRKDVNVMLVLDRSGSLTNSGSCGPMKQSAINFTNQFSNGRDYVGLVTFASSSKVDFALNTNFATASPNVSSIISNIDCTGGTSSAEGLWRGYQELVRVNLPNALNVILFFTDGQPTALTASFPIKSSSSCSSKSNKVAVLAATGSTPSSSNDYGLMNHDAQSQPLSSDTPIYAADSGTSGSGSNNCSYASSWPNNASNVSNDVSYIPTTDYYGASTNTGFAATLTGYSSQSSSGSGWAVSGPTIFSAAMDAADSTATRIRNGTTVPAYGRGVSNVFIFSIGLDVGSTLGVPGATFLKRAANDPASNIYNASMPAGLFLKADDTSDLQTAFTRVAAEILRIAR